MKKLIFLISTLLICTNVFAIEAKVVSVSGKVQVQKGNAWVDLKAGDVLKKGDLVQTGFKSEAQVAIVSSNQNSKLVISQLSRLTIEQLVENPTDDKTSVYLATGSAKSEIKKTEDRRASYTVRGPVATASVRGTKFNAKNTFSGAVVTTEQGVVTAWNTPSSEALPLVSDEQNDFSKAPHGSFAVSKNQSAEFSKNSQKTSCVNAVKNVTSLSGMTNSALENESDYFNMECGKTFEEKKETLFLLDIKLK
ncbi:MAG: FecR domain-containing protein [Treponema sp.]|nr:FecR domain-containing protein [Candidatus Treponema merdequi]